MKIFRVVTERHGLTIKAPGISETEMKREEFRFGADSLQEVWDHIGWLREDPTSEIVAIHEEHPAIDIIKPPPPQGGG